MSAVAADPDPDAPDADAGAGTDGDADAAEDAAEADVAVKGPTASARRRAAETIVTIWIDVARDLALAGAGAGRSMHDPDLLEETTRAASGLGPGEAAHALERLERAAMLLASNVSPELVLDDLALAWPRRRVVA